ncbi:MAG: tetratricopeptide repeat protein, partial [Planctomycetota bacterium]
QWRAGRREEAVMTLTRALRELGDHASLHINLGLFYSAQEDLDRARHHFQQAVQCDCTSVAAYRYLGLVESARGDFESAARAFQRALALDPNDLMLMYQLFMAADATGRSGRPVVLAIPEPFRCDSPSQIKRLAEYVVSEPDFVQAFLDMPVSEADEELFGVVLAVLHAALAGHPDYADLHYFVGLVLGRLGRPEPARGHLLRAIEINPEYRKALMALAELEAARGAAAQAVSYLQRAIACGADYPDVHVRIGELLVTLGMASLAREHFLRALRINSGYDRAARALSSAAA